MVRAGAALSLSGRFSVQGEQARRGLVLWAEHVNRQGGLAVRSGRPRRPVDLRIYDDASLRSDAAAHTERLIVDDRVDLLFGPYSSVLALAAAEVAERYGRVLWNHGGSSDAIDQRGWRWIVSLLTPASRYFEPPLDMLVASSQAGRRSARRVALLHGATGTFPAAVVAGAEAHARAIGLDVVLRASYPATRDELASLVRATVKRRPELILGVGATEADLDLAREIRRQRVDSALVGLVAAPIQLFQGSLGADANGFLGPSQWEPGLRGSPDLGPSSDQFSASFRGRFGLEPDYPAAQAYAAGLIAARCLEAAGSLDDDALRRAADALDVATFYGRFQLDSRTGQQVGHKMVIVQWQDGRKRIVWPPAVSTGRLQLPVPTAAPTP
jgi:branched-chain amino acid transport system substrate-binding protein